MTYLECMSTAQPPVNHSKCLYRVIGLICRCGHIKIEPGKLKIKCLNDKTARKGETTYHRRAQLTQPLVRSQKRRWEVHRLRRLCGGSKSRPRNVSRTQNGGNAYLGCINVTRSLWRPKRRIRRVKKLTFESRMQREHRRRCRRPKFKATNVSIVQEDEMAYLECASATQPHGNILKCAYRVVGPRCRHGCIKIIPRNVSQAQNGGNTYLGCANVLWSIRSHQKQSKMISNLTFGFRMLGEYWRDVEDYR